MTRWRLDAMARSWSRSRSVRRRSRYPSMPCSANGGASRGRSTLASHSETFSVVHRSTSRGSDVGMDVPRGSSPPRNGGVGSVIIKPGGGFRPDARGEGVAPSRSGEPEPASGSLIRTRDRGRARRRRGSRRANDEIGPKGTRRDIYVPSRRTNARRSTRRRSGPRATNGRGARAREREPARRPEMCSGKRDAVTVRLRSTSSARNVKSSIRPTRRAKISREYW